VAARMTILSKGISPFCHIDTAGTETLTILDTLVGPPNKRIIAVDVILSISYLNIFTTQCQQVVALFFKLA
jgi:hypothetical protein